MRRSAISSVLLMLLGASASRGADDDIVRLVSGSSERGRIIATTPDEVTLEKGGGSVRIAKPRIRAIVFGDEPGELGQARVNANNGGYKTALSRLGAINRRRIDRELVRTDVAFYEAYCRGRLALVGEGDLGAAARGLNAFVRGARDSHHFYDAVETLGELAAAMGRHEQAAKMYALIARSPHPALRMRAAVLDGESLQARGKHGEAITRFDEAINATVDAPGADVQRLAARIGKAESLAAQGELEAGLDLARGLVRDAADAEDPDLQAAGYNALGRCYEAAGRPTDALLAYLHTDLLFAGDPETHAEALSRLAALWQTAGKPGEAREARERLRDRYPQSRWARDGA